MTNHAYTAILTHKIMMNATQFQKKKKEKTFTTSEIAYYEIMAHPFSLSLHAARSALTACAHTWTVGLSPTVFFSSLSIFLHFQKARSPIYLSNTFPLFYPPCWIVNNPNETSLYSLDVFFKFGRHHHADSAWTLLICINYLSENPSTNAAKYMRKLYEHDFGFLKTRGPMNTAGTV